MPSTLRRAPRSHWVLCVTLAALGCGLAAFGGFVLLLAYGHATMMPAETVGWERWKRILEFLFLSPTVVLVLFGLFAVTTGLAAVAIALRRATRTQEPRSSGLVALAGIVAGGLVAAAIYFMFL